MGLKDVTLISGLKFVKTDFTPAEASHPAFKDSISQEFKKLCTRRSVKVFLVIDSLRMLNRVIKDKKCLTLI